MLSMVNHLRNILSHLSNFHFSGLRTIGKSLKSSSIITLYFKLLITQPKFTLETVYISMISYI